MGESGLEIVERQLGRRVSNFRRVVFSCHFGYPVVIESHPIRDGKPFPTLYWLTCPHLRKEVSKLEEAGWIERFEKMMEKDRNFKERMFRAHEEIIKRRGDLIEDDEIRKVMMNLGTGGISDWRHVKCLHLHLADYLAGVENPIGEIVWNSIKSKFCRGNRCSSLTP